MTGELFDATNEQMLKRFLDVNPDVATILGFDEPYCDILPHGGAERYEESIKVLEQWESAASSCANRENLTADQKLSLEYLRRVVHAYRFSFAEYPKWKYHPDVFSGLSIVFAHLLAWTDLSFERRVSAVSGRVRQIPTFLEQFRTRFADDAAAHAWTRDAITSCGHFLAFMRRVESAAKDNVSDELMENLRGNIAAADKAIADHIEWLKGRLELPNEQYSMGREKFAILMGMRGINLSAGELLAISDNYIRDMKGERAGIAMQISPTGSIGGAWEVVESNHAASFEETLERAKVEVEDAKRYLVNTGIASVVDTAIIEVRETPPVLKDIIPVSMCLTPCWFDKEQIGYLLISRPSDPEDQGKQLNFPALMAIALQEAYPGRFHQFTLANKKPWMFQLNRAIAAASDFQDQVVIGAEGIDGWALYSEKLMFDRGYKRIDLTSFARLTVGILQACRIAVDVNLAHGVFTTDEMTDWVAKQTGLPRDSVEIDVRKISKSPGVALSSLTGRHLISVLRKDLENKMGARFREKTFNDLVASYSCLPYEMLKGAVTSQMEH